MSRSGLMPAGESGGQIFDHHLVGPPEASGGTQPACWRKVLGGMPIERGVAGPLPDSVAAHAAFFRPSDVRPALPLVSRSPKGKQADLPVTTLYPNGGVTGGRLSAGVTFESPDRVHRGRHATPSSGSIPTAPGTATAMSPSSRSRRPCSATTSSSGPACGPGAAARSPSRAPSSSRPGQCRAQ